MTNYPKIATLYYKDRNIDVKIPIRIKLIGLVKYECPSCLAKDGLRNITNYVQRSLMSHDKYREALHWVYNEEMKVDMPHPLITSKRDVHCPQCFVKDGSMHKMKISTTDMFKLYTSVAPEYIDVYELVRNFVPQRWKTRHGRQQTPRPIQRTSLEAYSPDLNKLVESVDWFNQVKDKQNLKKGCKVKVEIHKVTLKELEEAREKYEQRKFIRAL